jgi:ketosteroid isomerase-like protein
MSENLDLVRSIYAAWERGDYNSAGWADPEIEYVWADGPSPGTWTGLAGLAEGWREWLTAWDDLRVQAEHYRELPEGRVLVFSWGSARGKASGLDTAQIRSEGTSVFQIHDSKVTRIVNYWDRDRALADLGLEG